jgi:carbonic anhydrase
MPVLNELLEANERFAEGFEQGDLPMPPARHVARLTCMDARLHPERFLGLDIGEAHVVRNAGGRASDDAVRSLIISSKLLGTREFVVIHHKRLRDADFHRPGPPRKTHRGDGGRRVGHRSS